MTHFLKLRLQTNQRLFALLIGLAIVSAHLLKVYGLSVKKHVTFTPYTAWLSMDFSGTSALMLLFYLLLPIIASLFASTIFLEDKRNHLICYVLLNSSRKKYFSMLFLKTFLTGAVVVALPLIIDLIGCFLLLPNLKPDPLINVNLGIYEGSGDLFPHLFYAHPLVYALFNIAISFVFAGLFVTFALAASFYIKNKMVILLLPFCLQLLSIAVNSFVMKNMALSPFGFSPEAITTYDKSFLAIVLYGGILFWVTLFLYVRGVKNNEAF